ncbi:MAG TPA: hypothetical protein VJ850_00645 [Candidatus Limnocylindrales bacterium]|nr:hypothetical protein [Candidatus Limnocylindrales bacterium]
MARAKQTNRAEARKRYRQAMQPTDAEQEGLDEPTEAAGATAKARATSKLPAPKPSTSNTPQRTGFTAAFRAAYHPAHPREDLRYLPGLLTHWSFLVSVLLIVGSTIAYVVLPNYTGTAFLLQLVVWPGQALAPQVIAGLFARRASYMLGFILGLLQGVAFVLLVTSIVSVTNAIPASQLSTFVLQSLLAGPVIGALYAAAAAWYRRFLRESSPRRQMQGRPAAKPAARRSTARR